MDMKRTLQRIGEIGIIPVIRAASVEDALLVAESLQSAGIPIVELTMTIPDAPRAIAEVAKRYGDDFAVGAGTVLSAEDARRCLDAGAKFLVSPGLSVPVVRMAKDAGVLAIPGILTPTELMNALEESVTAVKVFPCSSAGGPQHLRALRGPFPNVALIPTGGVNISNAAEYVAAGAFALGAGGDLFALPKDKDTARMTSAARNFASVVHAARDSRRRL